MKFKHTAITLAVIALLVGLSGFMRVPRTKAHVCPTPREPGGTVGPWKYSQYRYYLHAMHTDGP